MTTAERLRAHLDEAMSGREMGASGADQLCHACVEVLGVDGAAISYITVGGNSGTCGSSSEFSQRLDEYQFTFDEGPCFDALAARRPILAPDLAAPGEQRWPAFRRAVLANDVHAVFASPVVVASAPVGALDLFRYEPGALDPATLTALGHAAELAAGPLRELMTTAVQGGLPVASPHDSDDTTLGSLQRVEVYQATGVLMDQLHLGPAEALARLRVHALATHRTASAVAWDVLERIVTIGARDGSAP